ncbi:MAG: DNA polymerase III subunit delta [Sporocytophaga sp.]|nr:DNA polymerase III subunit delta [Sporocytophaga sp.]
MLFSQIKGLEETKASLIASVKNRHVAHAQLFAGPEGSGSLAMALAYATYINCEEKGETDSCGTCASCNKFNKLIHPDLHFVFPVSTTKSVSKDASSALFMKEWRNFIAENPYGGLIEWGNFIGAENKQLNISVDESRNIIKTVVLKSFEAEYKIMVIWLPEQMNSSSANAILKVLEEPPVKTIFLLITQNPDKIITTVLSRTQRVKIRPFTDEEVTKFLMEEKQLDEKKARQVAYLADGNLNEGLRLLQQAEEDNHQMFREWMRLCYKKVNILELVDWSEAFQKLGREGQKNLFQYGLNILRETLICRLNSKELLRLNEEDLKFVDGFSKALNEVKIENISKSLNEAYYHIERNANAKIVFLDLSLQISGMMKS